VVTMNAATSVTASFSVVGPPDTTAPRPNPMRWQSSPRANDSSSISMTAVTATDNSGVVQYQFLCVSGSQGCVNSSWQSSTQYTATGLAPNTRYGFKVKARDASGNETRLSSTSSATTKQVPPTTPTNLTGRLLSATRVQLNWDAVNATRYEVWRCRVINGVCDYGSRQYATASRNSYTGSIPRGAVVGFKVRAVNTAGTSGFSNEISVQ
jgi:hypothetical protein